AVLVHATLQRACAVLERGQLARRALRDIIARRALAGLVDVDPGGERLRAVARAHHVRSTRRRKTILRIGPLAGRPAPRHPRRRPGPRARRPAQRHRYRRAADARRLPAQRVHLVTGRVDRGLQLCERHLTLTAMLARLLTLEPGVHAGELHQLLTEIAPLEVF